MEIQQSNEWIWNRTHSEICLYSVLEVILLWDSIGHSAGSYNWSVG